MNLIIAVGVGWGLGAAEGRGSWSKRLPGVFLSKIIPDSRVNTQTEISFPQKVCHPRNQIPAKFNPLQKFSMKKTIIWWRSGWCKNAIDVKIKQLKIKKRKTKKFPRYTSAKLNLLKKSENSPSEKLNPREIFRFLRKSERVNLS